MHTVLDTHSKAQPIDTQVTEKVDCIDILNNFGMVLGHSKVIYLISMLFGVVLAPLR